MHHQIIQRELFIEQKLMQNTNKKENSLDKLIGMSLEDALRYVEELGYEELILIKS